MNKKKVNDDILCMIIGLWSKKPIEILPTKELYRLNQLGFIIGGSTALNIYGYTFDRSLDEAGDSSKEIDLITNNQEYIANPSLMDSFFRECKIINRYSGCDSIICYEDEYSQQKYDIIKSHNIIDFRIVDYDGFQLKIQNEKAIWDAKREYANNGSRKHIDDLKKYNK